MGALKCSSMITGFGSAAMNSTGSEPAADSVAALSKW
jgi:hypothetical protein